MENKCFYCHWHNVKWLTSKNKNCHFNSLTLLRIQEGGFSWFSSLCVCVCVYWETQSMWVHICIRAWLRYHRVWKKVMEEWAQERQTAKQHQISCFHSWAARRKKKKKKTSKEGLLSVFLHTDRKGLHKRVLHRWENSPLVSPISFTNNQLWDLSHSSLKSP